MVEETKDGVRLEVGTPERQDNKIRRSEESGDRRLVYVCAGSETVGDD